MFHELPSGSRRRFPLARHAHTRPLDGRPAACERPRCRDRFDDRALDSGTRLWIDAEGIVVRVVHGRRSPIVRRRTRSAPFESMRAISNSFARACGTSRPCRLVHRASTNRYVRKIWEESALALQTLSGDLLAPLETGASVLVGRVRIVCWHRATLKTSRDRPPDVASAQRAAQGARMTSVGRALGLRAQILLALLAVFVGFFTLMSSATVRLTERARGDGHAANRRGHGARLRQPFRRVATRAHRRCDRGLRWHPRYSVDRPGAPSLVLRGLSRPATCPSAARVRRHASRVDDLAQTRQWRAACESDRALRVDHDRRRLYCSRTCF